MHHLLALAASSPAMVRIMTLPTLRHILILSIFNFHIYAYIFFYTYIYIQQSFQHATPIASVTHTGPIDPFSTTAAADDDNTNDNNTNRNDNINNSSPTALLEALYDNVTNPQFDGLRVRLDTRITESTEYSKSSHVMRYQECFMLVAGGYT